MNADAPFSGECELAITPAAEIAAEDRAALTARWDAWITALDAGMFPPGQVTAPPETLELEGTTFAVQSVPAVAFRVLNGMLSHYSGAWAHLDSWSLRDRRSGANLLNTDADFPGPPPGNIALPLQIGPRSFGENTSIVIEFTHAIDAASRETIARTLEAWLELLNGGYPMAGYPEEDASGVAGRVRFLDPSTASIYLEFFRAAPESTTPLIHLLSSWRDRYPIERAYIER